MPPRRSATLHPGDVAPTWASLWTARPTVVGRRGDRAVLALRGAAHDGDDAVRDRIAEVALDDLVRALDDTWERGWQPRDLVRAARKLIDPHAERVVAAAVALNAEQAHQDGPVHPEWASQLDSVRATVPRHDPRDRSWHGLATVVRARDDVLVDVLMRTAALLRTLPPVPLLLPPPSAWADDPAARLRWATDTAGDGLDDRVLTRIRALLAKAESTTFPDEAEALTAKAQDLIARHAIDEVLLAAGRDADDAPVGRRVVLDDPYAGAKFGLLSEVAHANRCRAVLDRRLDVATVFGFTTDLSATELLFTSLLVQATAAMLAEGDGERSGGRRRAAGFRRAFLEGYAVRIGQRLEDASSSAVADAARDAGGDVLPVLAGRVDAVEQALADAFPRTRSRGATVRDVAAFGAGARAADRARLGTAEVRGSRRALGR